MSGWTREGESHTVPCLLAMLPAMLPCKHSEMAAEILARLCEAMLSCCSFGPMRSSGLGRRMEIIGASIMNGYGNLGNDQGCQPSYQVRSCVIVHTFTRSA